MGKEIELSTRDQRFALPDWVGQEVSGDARYLNSHLAVNPYRTWSRCPTDYPGPCPRHDPSS